MSSLLSRGYATIRPVGAVDITASGRERLGKIMRHARRFEDEATAGLDPADVAAARRVLAALAGRNPV